MLIVFTCIEVLLRDEVLTLANINDNEVATLTSEGFERKIKLRSLF